MYLNIILTILCLILITFLVLIVFIWKKVIKKIFDKTNNVLDQSKMMSQDINNPLKLFSELMKNLPKK